MGQGKTLNNLFDKNMRSNNQSKGFCLFMNMRALRFFCLQNNLHSSYHASIKY